MIKVVTETHIIDKKVLVDTHIESDQYSMLKEAHSRLSRVVMDTQEKAIHSALVSMGWTPPVTDSNTKPEIGSICDDFNDIS